MDSRQVQQLVQLVCEAGAATLPFWRSGIEVQSKADNSPVTAADMAAHRILSAGLPQILDIPVLSEEACDIPLQERQKWQRWWLVDPLDGTREFIAGSEEYTVNVALIEQGRVVFGMVGVPASDILYYGGRECGAFRVAADGVAEPIRVSVSAARLRVASSRSHGSPQQQALLAKLEGQFALELLSAGSSLKFCWLAEGRIDLYPRLGPTSQWDTAAAQAVLEGAGGKVLDWQGQQLDYAADESYLNPFFLAVNADVQLLQQVLRLGS